MRLPRVAVVIALLFGGVSQAHAQEKGADQSEAAASDAIAGAKKDLESIKSARDAVMLPKGGLPRVSVPELSLPSVSPAVGASSKQKKVGPESRSTNWLIEAMEKPEREREVRGPNSKSRDRQRNSGSRERSLEGTDETGRDSVRANDDEDGLASAVSNPLTRYLGDWMTPQDYALLKPGLSVDAGIDVKSLTTFGPLETLGTLPGTIGPKSGEFDFRSATSVVSAPRENPFLQTLTPGMGMTAAPVAIKPSVLLPPVPPLTATIAPPPPVPSAQTKIPDFAKPPTDEKYFKQLKRF